MRADDTGETANGAQKNDAEDALPSEGSRRRQFVRYETEDNQEYFAEVGTHAVVWTLPQDGELATSA